MGVDEDVKVGELEAVEDAVNVAVAVFEGVAVGVLVLLVV